MGQISAALLAVAIGGVVVPAVNPDPVVPWKLPKAEGDKWATRLRALAHDGWTIVVHGNDIVLQRDKRVRFARVLPNEPAAVAGKERIPDLHEKVFRLTLRFVPLMSMDEYERLAAENAASERERDRLQQELRLPHKFDDFIAITPEEKERLRKYRQAEAKLAWQTLPDLYTPNYSIFLYRPNDDWSYVYDKDVAAECLDIQETLQRYFGMYNPQAAAQRQGIGQPETLPGR